jgi:hypothetical protein
MKKLLPIFFICLGAFLLPKICKADYFYDGLESIPIEGFDHYTDVDFFESTSTIVKSGNSLTSATSTPNAYLNNDFINGSTVGTVIFNIYRQSSLSYFILDIIASDMNYITRISALDNNCNIKFYGGDSISNGAQLLDGAVCDDWMKLTINYDFINDEITAQIDNNTVSATSSAGRSSAGYYSYVEIDGPPYDDKVYVDDLELITSTPFVTTIDEIKFFPQLPHDCSYTKLATTTEGILVPISGHFVNPAPEYTQGRECTFDDITINFASESESNSTSTTLFAESIPDSDNYWSGYVTLPLDNYRVEYKAYGYDQNGEICRVIYYCKGTGVGYENITRSIDWWDTKYNVCTFNDCSALSWWNTLEKLWCNVEYLAMKMVCPTPEVLEASWGIIDDIQTRWPISYLNALKNMGNTVYENTASSTATSTMVAINIDQYNFATTTGLTFLYDLRNILQYFIIIIFLIWIIRYSATEFFS